MPEQQEHYRTGGTKQTACSAILPATMQEVFHVIPNSLGLVEDIPNICKLKVTKTTMN
jgi:hypothetical protein